MSHGTVRRITAMALAGGLLASAARAEQVVWLNFGTLTDNTVKTDSKTYKEDGTELSTLKKGDRKGFTPTEFGQPNNDNRAALIQQVVDQVKADYAGYNVTFTTTQPASGTYTTINIITGKFPDQRFPFPNGTHVQITNVRPRATFVGGALDGYYVDLNDGKIYKPDGTDTGLKKADLKQLLSDSTLGIAQHIDPGNKDKNKGAWIFGGAYTGVGTPEQNIRQLGNTISHELAHLLGLVHEDGAAGTIMGPTTTGGGGNYGTDKSFGDKEKKKLDGVAAPKNVQQTPRTRDDKKGDTDQNGTSQPDPPTGNPDQDAAEQSKRLREILEEHYLEQPFPHEIAAIRHEPDDPPFTDMMMPNGTTAQYVLNFFPPGVNGVLLAAWIELDIMNVADVLGGSNDFRIYVDGLELPGALDGLDQRISDPELFGYAMGQRINLHLRDFLSHQQVMEALSDGQLVVVLLVQGATPGVSVDSIKGIVIDGGFAIPAVSPTGLGFMAAGLLAAVMLMRRRLMTRAHAAASR